MPADAARDWREFDIEQTGIAVGRCECCGSMTKSAWGLVRRAEEAVGAYYIGWTHGMPDHGASFDLILGKWGDKTRQEDRCSASLDFRLIDNAPSFMVVDSQDRGVSASPLVGIALKRSDVIGTPIADHIFSIVDAVYMSNSAEEIRGWSAYKMSIPT